MDEITAILRRVEEARATCPEGAPLACSDADGTLWDGELGVQFTEWLVGKQVLEPDVMDGYALRMTRDASDAYAFLTTSLAGLKEREVQEYAAYFVERIWKKRLFRETVAFLGALEKVGAQIWIVSASARWVVEAAVRPFGVPRTRVIGMAVDVEEGVLTDRLIEPAVNREGKVQAIERVIGRTPLVAVGNSVHDLAMLKAACLAVLVNPSSQADPELGTSLRALGYREGWPVLDVEGRLS